MEEAITYQTLRTAITKLAGVNNGKVRAKAILSRFGARSMDDVPFYHYPKLIADLREAASPSPIKAKTADEIRDELLTYLANALNDKWSGGLAVNTAKGIDLLADLRIAKVREAVSSGLTSSYEETRVEPDDGAEM